MTIILKPRIAPSREIATIVDALAMWASWEQPFPPVDATGEADSDAILAAAFRDLIVAPDNDAALFLLEDHLFSTSDFPHPGKPVPAWRAVLIRWWMQMFEAGQ